MSELAAGERRPIVRQRLGRDELLMRGALVGLAAILVLMIAAPLYAIMKKAVEDKDGGFVGLENFRRFLENPSLAHSVQHSLVAALATTVITVTLASAYAYGLRRSCMRWKGLFRAVALIPLLAPSLLQAIALVYLFGRQGWMKGILFGQDIYGPIGIVVGEVFYCFPHALIILMAALSIADARLYEAAGALRASPLRTFFTVTLPGAKYGLSSAGFVVFTLVITDFGIPKVIGGWYNVLATDIYKQVIGQQNFQMGSVVSLVLLLPAVAAFFADRAMQRRQTALLTARAVPYEPKPEPMRDWLLFGFCALWGLFTLAMLGTAAFASFVKFWPYNLELVWKHYDFDLAGGGGWGAYRHSIELGLWVAAIGTGLVFTGAYLVEKTKGAPHLSSFVHMLAMLPMAVPGLVLGLAYIFFFNDPANPLGFIYRSMAILVLCTVAHYYTVAHLTAVTALKQLDHEFEAVSSSLKVPFYTTFWRVTVPVCMPAILDISIYLFINAMTTVSAVVFLYGPNTALASVAVLNMDDAGDEAPAAAMAMMIVYTAAAVRLAHWAATRGLQRASEAWRTR
jgi:iron(III) transport system permease protein